MALPKLTRQGVEVVCETCGKKAVCPQRNGAISMVPLLHWTGPPPTCPDCSKE